MNAIAVVSHIPWLLWAVHRLAGSERIARRTGALAAIGALTGSQILLGYPQYVWFSLLAEGAYLAALLAKRNSWHARAALAALAIAGKLLGVALGAVQWLPTMDSLSNSNRQYATPEFAMAGSLHPLNVLQLVAPYGTSTRVLGQNTHELGLYFGAVPLVLIVWGLGYRSASRSSRQLFWAPLMLSCAALLYAFGDYGPIYRLQTYLPVVSSFRFPCRAIVLAHFSFAIATAVAFSWFIDQQRSDAQNSSMCCRASVWTVPVISVLAAAYFTAKQNDFGGHLLQIWLGPILVTLAACLVRIALPSRSRDRSPTSALGTFAFPVHGRTWSLIGLIFLAAADLGMYGLSYAVHPHVARAGEIASNDFPAVAHGRVALDLRSIHRPGPRLGNQMLLAGMRRVDGYVGLEPDRVLDYRRVKTLQVASTSHVLRSAVNESDSFLPHDNLWLAIPAPLPRARLVTQARHTADAAGDLEQIDPRTTVLLDKPVRLSGGPAGIAEILEERPGRVRIEVECQTQQVLVWAESFHSGWQAMSKGNELQVYRAYGDFMACIVPPGEHQIEFSFQPQSLEQGRRVSLCGLGLLLCALATSALASRRFR